MGVHGSLSEPCLYMSHSVLGLSCNKSTFMLLLCFLFLSIVLITLSYFVVVVVVVLRPSPNTKVHMGLSLPAVLPRTQ